MADLEADVVIIGGGPGGYVAAIRAAQLGFKTICVEKRATLGGTCLNEGCIPSKALLESSEHYDVAKEKFAKHGVICDAVKLDLGVMMKRKDAVVADLTKGIEGLFKKNKVQFLQGTARFIAAGSLEVTDSKGAKQAVKAKHIIIATGSSVTNLPGITIDEKTIVSSTGALELKEVPKELVVIGGGYIGLEMGSVWRRLGANVTVVEYLDCIVPSMDQEIAKQLQKVLEKQGMSFMLGTKVSGVVTKGKQVELTLEPAKGGDAVKKTVDVVLVSVGRVPYTEGLGLDVVGVALDARGRVQVDAHYATNVPGIYAIGDVIAGPMLAHKAEEEGVALVEMLAGQKPHVNYNAIPGVVYTWPEVATVGQTEEELKKNNVPYTVGKFPFMANSRARAVGDTDGMVKIIACPTTDKILGVHIIGPQAGTMIAEAVLALEYHASSEDLARTCHAHPTLNEAVKEAALAVLKRPIHI
jgi:dihydrolipoamide dehydrogenase